MNLDRCRKNGLIIGIAGLVLTAIGLFISRDQFFRSYLWAFLFWFGLGLGCLALLMLYHLVGGSWGFTIRRIIESGTRTLPLMAVLFVPVLLGVHYLYEWSRPEIVAQSGIVAGKHAYLNTPFWAVRAVVYFAIWLFFAHRLTRSSEGFQQWSAPGLVVYGLTITFAMFDWAMSLEPSWYSSIYGLLWIVNQALSALALSIVAVALLSDQPPISRVSTPNTLHDLGNLLFAFVMLWAYLSFAQFLIIWSGNLPEEIHWYLTRLDHGWQWVAALVLAFHFAVPFFLLLARFNKRQTRRLAGIAFLVLLMRAVDTFWLITPAFYQDGIAVHWLDLFALMGIGGLWIAVFTRALGSVMPHEAL